MKFVFDIIKLSQTEHDEKNHMYHVFKITLGKIINVDNSKDFRIFIQTLIEGGGLKFIIDMKGLEFIDSAGMGIIINATKLLRSRKGDMILLNVSDKIFEIFKIINFESFIKIFNTERDAISYLSFLK
jgi:anti-sigma B factor antagonist